MSKAQEHSNGLKEYIMKMLNNSGKINFKYRSTRFETWKVDGKVAGYRKLVGKLELKTVNNAGHLVPMDQGPAALQLVKDFVVRAIGK